MKTFVNGTHFNGLNEKILTNINIINIHALIYVARRKTFLS